VIYVCFFEASISGCLLGKNCQTYRANEWFLAEKYWEIRYQRVPVISTCSAASTWLSCNPW
jgi:hypothetical protein